MRRILVVAVLLATCGCSYQVPFTKHLDPAKHARGVAFEQCARSHDWGGVWDLRVHSLHTCPFVSSGRAALLTVPPLQVISWPASWLGIMSSHQTWVYEYWKGAHDEEYDGHCSGGTHDLGSHGVPADAELWTNRNSVYIWGK